MPGKPIFLPAASYAPDMPDYNDEHTDTVLNVIPRTPKTYGPLSAPAPFSGALVARCQGAFFGLDGGGNVFGFAGDATDLYELTSASSNWVGISKSAAAYGCAADARWCFEIFGIRIIATDFTDPVQSFLIGVDSKFSDLITTANPPKARYAAQVLSFLMLANTNDPVYGSQPQRVWWSRNGDPTKFDDPTSQLAAQFETSFQDLPAEGGQIQGIVGNLGTADAAVVMEHAIWRVQFVGGAAGVFSFFPMEGTRGCLAAGSIAQLGPNFFYLGEDGVYSNDGTSSTPIGANRVDKTFLADLDQNYLGSISSAIDPINKLYIIYYPGTGHLGALCNKMIMYNWQIDRWSQAVPIDAGGEFIVRALSFGYTLDQLYTILGYNLDNLPYPLDSRVWTGGNLLLAIFDANHKLNFFTGNALAATIDSSEQQMVEGGLFRLFNARPIIDGTAVPSVAIAARNRQNDPAVFGAATAQNSIGTCPQRALGRYMRTETTIPAMSSWTHFSGVELEGVPAGVR